MKYIVIRIIAVAFLLLGATLIILQMMEGGKTVIQTLGRGGAHIGLGGALLGISLRLENKMKASRDPSNAPK